MRIFKHWVQHSKKLRINGKWQESKVFGGSNISKFDAINDAENKLDKAQKIIDRKATKDDEYEADIIEEIITIIDDNNIVTRNRYGALVLNCKNLLFIDVDDYYRSLSDFFFRRKLSKKELMLISIEKVAKKEKYRRLGFKIYETPNGYRILVGNKEFSPRSKESKKIMSDFGADNIYQWLCIKQNCYRARLSPKPYRIKQKGLKVIYPNRTKIEQSQHEAWLQSYEQKSLNFSACRFVKEIGNFQSNAVVEYHDKLTKAHSLLKLA